MTIHAGVGRVGSMPRTTRVTNTEHPAGPRIGAWSSTVTGNAGSAPVSTSSTSELRRAGSRKAAPVELRVLAGDAAHRQRVAAVGGDVDLDRVVVQAEQADRVRSELGVEPELGQAQDAVVLVAECRARVTEAIMPSLT